MADSTNQEINEYLTFRLAEENFALTIGKVREVLDMTSITKVPRTPEHMRGVINLRGNVAPVIDLRLSLGVAIANDTADTCIIIVEVMSEGEPMIIGALVDSVEEVVDIPPDQIGPPPKLGSKLKSEYITGMGKSGEKFLVILDIDKVLSDIDEQLLESVSSNGFAEAQQTQV